MDNTSSTEKSKPAMQLRDLSQTTLQSSIAAIATTIGLIGVVIFSCLLMLTGSGDNPESYRTWIVAASIIFGSGMISASMHGKDSNL